ncbi:MAG: hypothetical protein KBC96_11725 [Armatimonadetes bacterium]|nr:hypothetical protein [Armatimonadota bacterium]
MKRFLLAALAAGILLAPMPRAQAQYGDEAPAKLSFKVGLYTPSGADFGGKLEDYWRSLGLEYALDLDELDRPTTSVGAFLTNGDNDLVRASMVGVQYEKRWYGNQENVSSPYVAAGLGYNFLSSKARDFIWEPWVSRKGSNPGITVAAGYQFKDSFYGELRYYYSGELDNGVDFSGIGLSAGVRLQF